MEEDTSNGQLQPPSPRVVIKTLVELLKSDEELKASLGKYLTYFILASLVIATLELTVGLPIITLSTSPLVGGIIVFLYAEVETWLRSRKPKTIFYLCPKERKFIPIHWSSLPRYRKLKACPTCGTKLIKKCQKGKHYIVSPDFSNPDKTVPDAEGFCPLCDPDTPEEQRRYLPKNWRENKMISPKLLSQ